MKWTFLLALPVMLTFSTPKQERTTPAESKSTIRTTDKRSVQLLAKAYKNGLSTPLAGVTVSCGGVTAVTNSSGEAYLTIGAPGAYTVTFTYPPCSSTVTVSKLLEADAPNEAHAIITCVH